MGHFKPLRRKIGVLTLLLACMALVGWVRSNTVEDLQDVLRVAISQRQRIAVKSRSGAIDWTHYDKPVVTTGFGSVVISDDFGPSESKTEFPEWERNWCGFIFAEQRDPYDGTRIRFCSIPYWSIVIPLTAFTAWLLLSTTPAKVTKPASES